MMLDSYIYRRGSFGSLGSLGMTTFGLTRSILLIVGALVQKLKLRPYDFTVTGDNTRDTTACFRGGGLFTLNSF